MEQSGPQEEGHEFFSVENIQKNESVVEFTQTAMCVVTGSMAGVVGLTAFQGFVFMVVLYLVTSTALLAKMRFDVETYFNMKWYSFLFYGIGGHFVSFILFWTLGYGMVHIY
ncbi:unnamed protein product [Aphanomyces euteiches]|uniref:ER membrane protein complex subunit 6 n=1 Tax=Aphanomyces euteiches TaxID=100861 RepID=A0A6G0WPJ7_9STRA|nr:hypothetical protein Ae201684_013020 [Aphanomyces euteiches]KAH9076901.1 hypothetical protein Ae201684P_010832 [Aphanomyces euteiches]KAH9110109.1 hypothetical protein AeMF1_014984 [Aphanomyces euteiches]KAH9136541.1 hypothetical protein LEN26_006113 [Aphanomyces euteiches]KAH9139727.1 hypothetical protein AeRB84_015989 [Aphanomyces euteiches]